MDDFQVARSHMVDCQIRTNGVIDEAILDAFETVPRELFVPADKKAVAYTDKPVMLPGQRVLMDPMTHARLLQAAAPQPDEVALSIGASSGYSAAVLSPLVTTVLALESDPARIDEAMATLDTVGVHNAAYIQGNLPDGAPDQAPFDVIMINGAVAEVPPPLLDQLAIGGRLVAVVRPDGRSASQAVLFVRHDTGHISRRVLFDISLPYLAGFEPKDSFVF